MKNFKLLLPLILFLLLVIAYYPILNWFFARDDFGFLPHLPTTLNNISAILTPPNYWFFRPLSQQFYFWAGEFLWGLNQEWFRLFALALLGINSWLVYKLTKRFTKTGPAIISAVFYGLNTTHLFEIGWICANYQTISATLFLLTVLLATAQNKKAQLFSFVTLFLSFLSSEMSVFAAPVIVVYKLIKAKERPLDIKPYVKSALPYLGLTLFYLVFYFSYVRLPGGDVYGRFFDPGSLIKILGKYLAYPFVAGFDRSGLITPVNMLLALKMFIIFQVAVFAMIERRINWRLVIFGSSWFLITISIFIFLSNHTFAYLEAIPMAGLSLVIATTWEEIFSHKKIATAVTALLVATSFVTLVAAQTTDPNLKWLNEHQQASRYYLSLSTLTYPKNNRFVLDRNDEWLMETTYFGHIISAFYKDKSPAVILK